VATISPEAASPAAEPPETRLEYADNRKLIDLCGAFDRNLAVIEQGFGVAIQRRGNVLALHGEPDARARAQGALDALYQRLEAGRSVEPGDVDAAIRMPSEAPVRRATDQLELFEGGRVEIRTRKKTVEPRTEAQKAYARALFKNELVFGLGPAGTGKT